MTDKVESRVDGHFCPWCGLPVMTVTRYDDGTLESQCQNCGETARYTVEVSGLDGCKATLRPQKTDC